MTKTWLQNLRRALAATLLVTSMCLVDRAQQPPAGEDKAAETKTGAIGGTVVNENGQPLVGVTVFVRAVGSATQGRTTTTDVDGSFQVKDLDPAAYSVSAWRQSSVSQARDQDDPQQFTYFRVGDSVRLVQLKGGVITGTVTNSSGDAVVSVAVHASMIRDGNGQPPRIGLYQSAERMTDDRGIYRIYGLAAGTYVVWAGGANRVGSFIVNAFDSDAPTYAPSSTRDTAAEITVRAGDETSNVDIRYRGEPGRTVSGSANGPAMPPGSFSQFIVTLTAISNGLPQLSNMTFQAPGGRGFAFYGVVDGEYDLAAQSNLPSGESANSEPRRITVKGGDVTGIELTTKPLSSIAGRITLETSQAPECKDKRRPLFAETLITVARNEKNPAPASSPRFFGSLAAPDKDGAFTIRNVPPGQYNFNAQFFAKYWFLKSISSQPAVPPAARTAAANQPVDAAKNWTTVKLGERVGELHVTLAAGAASLRGQLTPAEGQKLPPKLLVYLVPAEREKTDDVLRFFVAPVTSDGNFVINNLAPGRYWLLARAPAANGPATNSKLRLPDESATRSGLRREAESAKTELELKPCQNVTDKFPLKLNPTAAAVSATVP